MTSTPANVLARTFLLSVNTGTVASPTWTPIKGITGISPAQSAQRTDNSDFDTNGWESHDVVMRGRSLSVAMNYKADPTDGSEDPGQAAVIALGDATGTAAKKQFKYVAPGTGGKGHTFTASADIAWPGGDKVNNAVFTADLTVDGAPTPLP